MVVCGDSNNGLEFIKECLLVSEMRWLRLGGGGHVCCVLVRLCRGDVFTGDFFFGGRVLSPGVSVKARDPRTLESCPSVPQKPVCMKYVGNKSKRRLQVQ